MREWEYDEVPHHPAWEYTRWNSWATYVAVCDDVRLEIQVDYRGYYAVIGGDFAHVSELWARAALLGDPGEVAESVQGIIRAAADAP